MTELECGDCTLCCFWPTQDRRVRLYQNELNMYEYEITPEGEYLLATKPDTQECYYLGPDGCTIHSFAPQYCKGFDCRDILESMPEDVMHLSMIVAAAVERSKGHE